jgi:hypothetical protein
MKIIISQMLFRVGKFWFGAYLASGKLKSPKDTYARLCGLRSHHYVDTHGQGYPYYATIKINCITD